MYVPGDIVAAAFVIILAVGIAISEYKDRH